MSDAKKKPGHLVYGRTVGLDNKEVLVDNSGAVQIGGTVTGTITGSIAVDQDATADATNSTTTPLAGNATFTGTSVDALHYGQVSVTVESNVNSATNGVQIQFSGDGTNWDDSSIFNYVAGIASPNAGNTFSCGIRSRYYRIVYINGSSAQANFRLATVARVIPASGDITDLAVAPTLLNHGLLTRSAIVGKSTAGGGTLVDVKVNPSGSLQAGVTAADGDVYVRSGLGIPSHDYVSLTQNSTQDIWTYKSGGSGGTTVATVTITYTDSAKGTISTVAKT